MVTIPMRRTDLCDWDEKAKTWLLETGLLTVQVGGTPDQLTLKGETEIAPLFPIMRETTAIHYTHHTNSGEAIETRYIITRDSMQWQRRDMRNDLETSGMVSYDSKDFDELIGTLSQIPFRVFPDNTTPTVGNSGYYYFFYINDKKYLEYGSSNFVASGQNYTAEKAIDNFTKKHIVSF